jgi:membrane dipeptidase
MKRREFITALGALGFAPRICFSQQAPNFGAHFADMHSHLLRRQGVSREALARQRMLVVAEKVIPDGPLIRLMGNRLGVHRDAQPGEMRKSFEAQFQRLRGQIERERVPTISSISSFEQGLRDRTPAIALSSEGADFLEGDLGYLDKVRAEGLVVLQLVHYRISDVGDISTEEPKHNGLTAFGRDVVRAANRLGMLIDVAHCTSAGIEQVLEISTKPVIYSHGHVTEAAPAARLGGIRARAIHAPLAKRVAETGGVVGIWPLGAMFRDREAYVDALVRTAETVGVRHVGIGSDINGLTSTVLPTHDEFAEVADLLGKRGLKAPETAGIMGDNFIRALGQALTT